MGGGGGMIMTAEQSMQSPMGTPDRSPEGGHPYLPPGMDMEVYRNLVRHIQKNYENMSEFRKERLEIQQEKAGNRFNGRGLKHSRPVNMIAMGLNTHTQRLAGALPQIKITPQNTQVASFARDLEIDTNRDLRTLRLDEKFEAGVLEGLVGLAIAKVYWRVTDRFTTEDGYEHERGEPTVELVDGEDALFDLNAKWPWDLEYVGNRYTMRWDAFMASSLFKDEDKERMRKHRASPPRRVPWEERSIDVANADDKEQPFEDRVALRDIYLPPQDDRPAWFMTIAEGMDDPPLRGHPWIGAPHVEPFYVLSFDRVPGTALPFPPARHWVDLHKVIANLYAKLARQAQRQKSILPVPTNSEEDVKRINATGDGKAFKTTGTTVPKEVSYGGPNQVNAAFSIQARQLFSYVANNLDLLAGLGAQSPTLGQDQILNQSATASLASLERRARKWMRDICRAVAFYRYHDPHYATAIPTYGPDNRIAFETPWSYDDINHEGMLVKGRKHVDFFNFTFDIEAFSSEPRTPSQKLQAIMQVFQILGQQPAFQMLMQQGLGIDMRQFINEVARLTNLEPELKAMIINNSVPEAQPAEARDGSTTKPANTTRTYNRVNQPTRGTMQGSEKDLMGQYLGSSSGMPSEEMMA
jgi:hypothetical protein